MDGIIVERVAVNRLFRRNVGFWFGMHVWTSIAEKHNVYFEDFDKLDPEVVGVDTLFFAAEWYAFKHGKRRIKYKDAEKWVLLMPNSQMKRIHDCIAHSKVGGRTIMEMQESKKKQAQKK